MELLRQRHEESLKNQEELLNEMEVVNRMTEREKNEEEVKRKARDQELKTQVSVCGMAKGKLCESEIDYFCEFWKSSLQIS